MSSPISKTIYQRTVKYNYSSLTQPILKNCYFSFWLKSVKIRQVLKVLRDHELSLHTNKKPGILCTILMTYKVIDMWEQYFCKINKLRISQSKYGKNSGLLWFLMDFHLYDHYVKVLGVLYLLTSFELCRLHLNSAEKQIERSIIHRSMAKSMGALENYRSSSTLLCWWPSSKLKMWTLCINIGAIF